MNRAYLTIEGADQEMRNLIILILLTLTQVCSVGYAQYITGPVATSLGGAGRGASDQGEQVYLNPATMVHAPPFTSSLVYFDGYTARDEHDRNLGITVGDNSEGIYFSGSYSYFNRRMTFANTSTREDQYHQASLARFIVRQLAMGTTFIYQETDLIGGAGYKQWDAHLGLHYNPNPDFGVGLVFYNLGPTKTNLPESIRNLDKTAIGVHYIAMPTFRVRSDIVMLHQLNPDHKMEYQVGIESKMAEFLFFRLGYNDDGPADRQYLTTGVGFDGPKIKIDYVYKKNLDYGSGAMHGVDMRMPFW